MSSTTTLPASIFTTPILGTIEGIDGQRLVVVHRSNLDSLAAGAACESVLATTDGRHPNLYAWHDVETDGPEGEWVYFERIERDGSGSHGWVDAASRKVLQTG